jgi:prepilin-type N-terminal cleavage/methylation domain-containing protein
MRARRGFSFVEILTVMIIIGLIVRIAVPRFHDMKRRATAGKVVGDVHSIRVGSYTYYTEKGTWPPEYGAGIVPTELVTYLPQNFSFTFPEYTFDYEVWPLSGGMPGNPQQSAIIAVSVTTVDIRLAQQLLKMAGKGFVPFAAGNKVTFFVSGATGN